jgi:hypothetical protein
VPSYPENEPASGGLGEHWDPDLGGSAALGLAGLAAQPAGATVVGLTESARPIEIARPINRSMTGATLPSRRGHLSFSTLARNTRVDYRANTDDERDRQSVLIQREPQLKWARSLPGTGIPADSPMMTRKRTGWPAAAVKARIEASMTDLRRRSRRVRRAGECDLRAAELVRGVVVTHP